LQATHHGGVGDAFVTKLTANGSALIYSTYLGGSAHEFGTGIAVDLANNAYITGFTCSVDFPTVRPLQPTLGGGPTCVQGGTPGGDAFVVKLTANGSTVYATYLGGSDDENAGAGGSGRGGGIAVDASGAAYVTGTTASLDFPTVRPLQGRLKGVDAFVAKLNVAGSELVYATYLGGSDDDEGGGIAVDASGAAYVTGLTTSLDFPTANPVQSAFGGGFDDAFVAKLNPSGSALVFGTFLGGSCGDLGTGIVIDGRGSAYVVGITTSADFPTTRGAFQPSSGTTECSPRGVDQNAFVAKIVVPTFAGTPGKPNCHGESVSALAHEFGGLDAAASALGFPSVQALQDAIRAFCEE
jgi:Beta-propeller repeat